jgi:hypothetical protein
MTTTLSRDTLIGFFELDDSGKVRYSRTAIPQGEDGPCTLLGQDFFELAPLNNRDELKRLFRRFIDSRQAEDSFPFDCLINDDAVRTRVTFTRAFETDLFPPESIVMLSIRECSH